MRLVALVFGLVLSFGGWAAPTNGQTTSPLTEGGRGEELTVYLMTMGPGTAVWERFGHNALLVRDAAAGTEVAYNYGMFSFDQENFILRFIRGEMDYWMEGFDGEAMAQWYIQANRSVWLQELNLTPEQRADLREFLEWNAQPENRFYRYDYYYDNCSTRVRDAIDLAIGGQLRAQTEGVSSGTTFRDHTRALSAADPLLYTGLMVGLGQPVDRTISPWEEMFLPMRLRDLIGGVTVRGADGREAPLVLGEEELYRSSIPAGQPIPPSRIAFYLVPGLLFGAVILLVGRRTARREGGGRPFSWVAVTWSLLAGLLGVILLALWAFTDHTASYRNENIFYLSPLLLILAFTVPLALRRGGGRAARSISMGLGIAVAVISILGLALQVLPTFSQVNGEIIALVLPINLALAIALFWIWRGRRSGDPVLDARRSNVSPTGAFASRGGIP